MKYSIIYTFFLTLITPFLLFADFEIPAWNQSLPYSANFLVLDENNVTYISLQEVEEGKTLDSTEYWQKLEEAADSFATPSGKPDNEPDDLPPGEPPLDTNDTIVASGHPSASNEAFVKQQYIDFLEREADVTGLNAWVDILDNGLDSDGDGVKDPFTRADLVNIKVSSAEFDGKIAPVTRLYFAYYGRLPDPAGFEGWINYKIGKGPNEWAGREMTIEEMSQYFATAQEFIDKYGSLTDSEFVALLYENVQGRTGSTSEISSWVDVIQNGFNGETWNRGRVMVGFSESTEYKTKMDPEVRVVSLYWGLLNRIPDSVGWDGGDGDGGAKGWPDYIKEGWSPNALINGFLDSQEYLNRFDSTTPYAEK